MSNEIKQNFPFLRKTEVLYKGILNYVHYILVLTTGDFVKTVSSATCVH